MSTRCNIKITEPAIGKTVWLYRHCDGYPAETGADLVQCVRAYFAYDCEMLAQFIMRHGIETDEHTGFRMNYELTSNINGDIEHLYVIELGVDTDGNRLLGWGHAAGYGPSIEANVIMGNRAELVGLVNQDRKARNARLDILCKQPAYAEMYGSDRYEMITL